MRHRNDGLRKLCTCSRRRWSECQHSWYFNFKWKDQYYRFSLDKESGKHIDSKSDAETLAEEYRVQIRDGKFRATHSLEAPIRDTLTLAAMMDQYRTQHLVVHRPTTLKTTDYMIAKIMGTLLVRPDGQKRYFGAWLVNDITADVIEQYRRAQLPSGVTGTNRPLNSCGRYSPGARHQSGSW